MMHMYYDKARLYSETSKIFAEFERLLNYDASKYVLGKWKRFDPYKYAGAKGISVKWEEFSTPNFGGVSYANDEFGDLIIINSTREIFSQVFDFTHEIIHLAIHRNSNGLSPLDGNRYIHSNSIIEWQANEGAAELLLHWKNVLRFVGEISKIRELLPTYNWFINEGRCEFGVSAETFENRIVNLKYELFQFLNGVPISKIELRSKRQLDREGILIDTIVEAKRRGENVDNNYPVVTLISSQQKAISQVGR